MPELPEVHHYKQMIDQLSSPCLRFESEFLSWPNQRKGALTAKVKGKQLLLSWNDHAVVIGFGLKGRFIINPTPSKSIRGTFILEDGCRLCIVDEMNMTKWSVGDSWPKNRGPDPVVEHVSFCQHVKSGIANGSLKGQIGAAMLNQAYFNGIGNYLRAEILHRAKIYPMDDIAEVAEKKPDEFELMLASCKSVPEEILAQGLNKYGTDAEKARFLAWLQVYDDGSNRNYDIDSTKRKIFFHIDALNWSVKKSASKVAKRLFSCAQCPKHFATQAFLDKHVALKHSPIATTSSTVFSCAQCPKHFATQAFLDKHASYAHSANVHVANVQAETEHAASAQRGLPKPFDESSHPSPISVEQRRWVALEHSKLGAVDKSHFQKFVGPEGPIMEWSNAMVLDALSFFSQRMSTPQTSANISTSKKTSQRQPARTGLSADDACSLLALFCGLAARGDLSRDQHRALKRALTTESQQGLLLAALRVLNATNDAEDFVGTLHSLLKSKAKEDASKMDPVPFTFSSSLSSIGNPGNHHVASVDLERVEHVVAEPVVPVACERADIAHGYAGNLIAKDVVHNAKSTSFTILPPAAALADRTRGDEDPTALPSSWASHLAAHMASPGYAALLSFVEEERRTSEVVPRAEDVFRAFHLSPLDQVRVVILGQDPYHDVVDGVPQAHGLCFSVQKGFKVPPSLRRIFKVLQRDEPTFAPQDGDLTAWAKAGVLMLNSILTVRAHKPASHARRGWEDFTDAVIRVLNEHTRNVVFLLWGGYSKKKGALVDRTRHLVLESAHPSPLSGSSWLQVDHFREANAYLTKHNKPTIPWTHL